MGDRRMETVYTEYVADDHEDDRASISSKRTRSPRRDAHRNPPWKQSPSNRQDIDVRSQCSDRRVRDIREDPEYQTLRENLSRPRRGEERRSHDHNPREDHPRGSMSSRGEYARSEPGRLEPRHYEHKPKERKPRPPNYPRPHDDEDDRRSTRRD